MKSTQEISDQAMDAAKQLAPWSTALPWWAVLIEGIVVGAVGVMVVFDPVGANVTLALALSGALIIAGLLQFWALWRNPLPSKADTSIAARSAIAVYGGLLVLILYFIPEGALTRASGFGIFGTAAVAYGLLALVQVIRTSGSSRRRALVEFLLFTVVGVITLWGLYAGGANIITAVSIIGWILLVGGIALIGLAIWRQQKGEEADEMIDSFTGSVSNATDKVTSIGQKKDDDMPTAEEVAGAVEKQQNETAEKVEDLADDIADAIEEQTDDEMN